MNVPTRMGRREGGIEEREREGIARDDGECASRREEKLRLWERALQEKEKQLKGTESFSGLKKNKKTQTTHTFIG